jgi:hypothetical protein
MRQVANAGAQLGAVAPYENWASPWNGSEVHRKIKRSEDENFRVRDERDSPRRIENERRLSLCNPTKPSALLIFL